MLSLHWVAILSSALIPLLVGMFYYNDKVMGNAWMRAAALEKARLEQSNMLVIFGFTLLLSLLLSVFFIPTVLHINHLFSVISQPGGGPPDPNSEAYRDAMAFYQKYGQNFRTFKHGALHGTIAALLGIWPVLGINALFERRGWRYVAIHLGYWVITFALMGGVVCAFA